MPNESAAVRSETLSLRQLRLFESVGRLQSIRRASEDCNLSQPAVTQALAKLETQIGVTLLDRRTSGSYLNELGVILHRRVVRFFTQLEQAISELDTEGDPSGVPATARRLKRSQIRSLLVLIETGSLADAANALGLSQASLQRTLHDLERSLGPQLYCHAAHGIVITPTGAAFGRKLKLGTQEVEAGLTEIDAALGHSESKILIGAMPGGGSLLLASILDEFVGEYPNASIRIASGNASEMLSNLLCGSVDIVIGLIPEKLNEELLAQPLASTPYEIVARRGHRLAHQASVTPEDLAAYDWIVGTSSSSRRVLFDQLFSGMEGPRTPIVTSAMAVIRHLLNVKDHLTLMTSYERVAEGNKVVTIPFPLPGPVPQIGMITRRTWLPTSMHGSFAALLLRRMAGAHVPHLLPRAG